MTPGSMGTPGYKGGDGQRFVSISFICESFPTSAAGAMANKSWASILLEGDLPRSTRGPVISVVDSVDSAVISTIYLLREISPNV